MQHHLLKIHLQAEHSFDVQDDITPNQWHYHPEIELVHIIQGSGRQFIGDNIHHFKSNDMFLLGANLPHLWKTDDKYLRKNSVQKMESIVIHFTGECFGADFFRLPENKDLQRLFDRAQQGLRIKNETRAAVASLMRELVSARKSRRIVLLLQILQLIAESRQTKPVSSKGLEFHYNPTEAGRMNEIYQYIMKNFSREISLGQIAKVVHISPNAFCRYFKSRVKKTFSRFLMEVRIGHACKLLAETNRSVADICYNCGFNNFSNFNRHFKAITRRTPMAHRQYYQEIREQQK